MLSRRNVIAGGASISALPAEARPSRRMVADCAIAQAVTEAINAHACPGTSVAIARAGAISVSQGFGMANLETRSALSERSIFRIGSLTKQFTAAAIIKLASLDRLDVQATVATYLPALNGLKPFTLLELMNHTAGLHSDEGDEAGSSCATPSKTQIAPSSGRRSSREILCASIGSRVI